MVLHLLKQVAHGKTFAKHYNPVYLAPLYTEEKDLNKHLGEGGRKEIRVYGTLLILKDHCLKPTATKKLPNATKNSTQATKMKYQHALEVQAPSKT